MRTTLTAAILSLALVLTAAPGFASDATGAVRAYSSPQAKSDGDQNARAQGVIQVELFVTIPSE